MVSNNGKRNRKSKDATKLETIEAKRLQAESEAKQLDITTKLQQQHASEVKANAAALQSLTAAITSMMSKVKIIQAEEEIIFQTNTNNEDLITTNSSTYDLMNESDDNKQVKDINNNKYKPTDSININSNNINQRQNSIKCDENDITITTSNTVVDTTTEENKSSKRKINSVTNELLLATPNKAPAIEVNESNNNILDNDSSEQEVKCIIIGDKGIEIVKINNVQHNDNDSFMDTSAEQQTDFLINDNNDLIKNTNNMSCIETIENDGEQQSDNEENTIITKIGEHQINDVSQCR